MRSHTISVAHALRVAILLSLCAAACDCEGKMLVPDDGATDSDIEGGQDADTDGEVEGGTDGGGDAGPTCSSVLGACSPSMPCCAELVCDPGTSTCISEASGCGLSGASCDDPSECCSMACGGDGTCATSCVQNTGACDANGDCCSGNCVGDVCVAATGTTCATTGNACAGDAACCSRNCVDGTCAPTGGSCRAFGDTCYAHDDCCSAHCSENGTGVGGVCDSLGVPGTGSCLMAGEPCGGDCASCCSRTCVPTATGGSVCLLASGCALESELCQDDADCCGSTPSEAGIQICLRAQPGDAFGRCSLTGTTPDGNVCKSATPWCEASIAPSNCGNCEAPKAQCCRIDPNGTPRCFGGSTPECPAGYDGDDPNCCAPAGTQCNFTGECCDGAPCLPDENDVLRCGASCSQADDACTTSADCCLGLVCQIPAGELLGTCGEPTTPPPPVDGGTPPVCAQFGQACGDAQACCAGITCQSPATGAACAAGEEGCTCFGIVIE